VSVHFAAAARMESTRSRRPTPAADPKAWILHGHVWGPDRAPVVGAKVCVHRRADGRDEPIDATTTAADGYFKLSLAVTPAEKEAERLAPVLDELRREPPADEAEEVRALRKELRELDTRYRAGRLAADDRTRFLDGLARFAAIRRIVLPPAADAAAEIRRRIGALEPLAAENRISAAEAAELTRLRDELKVVEAAAVAALYLRVTDAAGKLLLAEEEPLAASLGSVTYRDLETR
jgi:hypothetical protein